MKPLFVTILFIAGLLFTACSNRSVEPAGSASKWKVSGEAVIYTQTRL